MSMKQIREAWRGMSRKPLTRQDLVLYLEQCKNYLTTPRPGDFGLCWYADQQGEDVGNKSAYTLWHALAAVRGSVAAQWQQKLDNREILGGRTMARVNMVKALIVELEEVIQKDMRKR